jgi:hypothetical protein
MVQAEGTNRVMASRHREETISARRTIPDESSCGVCVKIAIVDIYHGLQLAQRIAQKIVRQRQRRVLVLSAIFTHHKSSLYSVSLLSQYSKYGALRHYAVRLPLGPQKRLYSLIACHLRMLLYYRSPSMPLRKPFFPYSSKQLPEPGLTSSIYQSEGHKNLHKQRDTFRLLTRDSASCGF